jgi:hypothetical protein
MQFNARFLIAPLAASVAILLRAEPFNPPVGPHIEPYPDRPRPPFLVLAGVTNLARGREVVASVRPITGELAQVTDGTKEPLDEEVVELRRGVQWLQVNLGRPCRIYAIVFWHDHRRAFIVYHDVVVQLADDPDITKNVRTIFNNDYDNTTGLGRGNDKEYFELNQGKLLDARGQVASHIRFYSSGTHTDPLNCYSEIEVYGFTVETNRLAVTPRTGAETNLVPLQLRLPAPCLK